jgi:hypothetical protein
LITAIFHTLAPLRASVSASLASRSGSTALPRADMLEGNSLRRASKFDRKDKV